MEFNSGFKGLINCTKLE